MLSAASGYNTVAPPKIKEALLCVHFATMVSTLINTIPLEYFYSLDVLGVAR